MGKMSSRRPASEEILARARRGVRAKSAAAKSSRGVSGVKVKTKNRVKIPALIAKNAIRTGHPLPTTHRLPRIRKPDVKRRGERGEAAFLAKATSMGFGVAKPWGDSDRYDLVVDVDGRLLKVQVKSAHCVSASPGGGYNLRCCGHRRKSYTAAEIDILVGYIATENIWYIFPPRAFKKMRSLRLFPHHKQKTSKFERYREAWEAFYEAAHGK